MASLTELNLTYKLKRITMKTFFLTLSLLGVSILILKAGSNADSEQAANPATGAPGISLEGREDLIKFFLQEKPFDFLPAYRNNPKTGEGC
jgi:hypothetical protein